MFERKKSETSAPLLSKTVSDRKEFGSDSPKEGKEERHDRTFVKDNQRRKKRKRNSFIRYWHRDDQRNKEEERKTNAPILNIIGVLFGEKKATLTHLHVLVRRQSPKEKRKKKFREK